MNELLNRKNRLQVRAEEAELAKVQKASEPEADAPVVTEPGSEPMDRYTFAGLPIVVENKKGSIRKWGEDPATGKSIGSLMHFDYGYIDDSVGADGDEVDVYIGPDTEPEWVYVVHQMKAPEFAEFDEDKTMLGWADAEEAKASYEIQYDDPRFFGGMSQMRLDAFKKKIKTIEGAKITNSVEKAVSAESTSPDTLVEFDDEDLKAVANEVAELWASLYGSALDSPKQAISEVRVDLPLDQIQAIRERRKRSVVNDEPLPSSKIYLVTNEGKAHGLLSMNSPRELSVEEFMSEDLQAQHLTSDAERQQRWPDANRLFSHDVLAYFDFGAPVDPSQVEYKAIAKMTRGDLIKLAEAIEAEAARRDLDIGLPQDLRRQFQVAKDSEAEKQEQAHPQVNGRDLYMPPNDPNPDDAASLGAQPKEYASTKPRIPGVMDPIDGPKGHEWGSNNPAQQEWDSGDYSHYGDGDSSGYYEFSLSGGARYVPNNFSEGSPTEGEVPVASSDGAISSGDLGTAGKRNPIVAHWRTTLTKAAVVPTVRMLLEARIHEAFTITADYMHSLGLVDRQERIQLSGLIGKTLDEFGGSIPYELGVRPLDASPEVESYQVSKSEPPVSAKVPPDIIMANETPATVGPASASPQWGPTAKPQADQVGKEAQFVADEPPALTEKAINESQSADTKQDVRAGYFTSAAGDDYMVEQNGPKTYPFVLQHHFRGIWSQEEREELRTDLQKAEELMKSDPASADQLLEKTWKEHCPQILTTKLEKISSEVQSTSDDNGDISSVMTRNLDSKVPKAIDLQKVLANIVNLGNVHTEFRVRSPGGDWLIGWTMDTPEVVLQTLDGKLLRLMRNRVLDYQPGDQVKCQQKGRMGVGWLHLVTPVKSIFRVSRNSTVEHGIATTKDTAGEIRYLDRGTAIFGVQKTDYHEMFLSFEKNQKLSGRWELHTEDAKSWLLDRPKDQTPYISSHDQAKEVDQTVVWNQDALAALKAEKGPEGEVVAKFVSVFKSATEEERTVFGIVLEPETMDAHGDVISAAEIQNAAYGYMEFYQQKGFQHGRNPRYPALPDGLRLLESWVVDPAIFPTGFMVGSKHIKPGTWLLKMRVDHDGLWSDIKTGLITGFSIGGFARSVVEHKAA
jgi:hypothetical protein